MSDASRDDLGPSVGWSHVWKVGAKVFAVWGLGAVETCFTFKVNDLAYEILKGLPGLRPAPYLALRGLKWIQHFAKLGLSDAELRGYIRQSNDWAKLAKADEGQTRTRRKIRAEPVFMMQLMAGLIPQQTCALRRSTLAAYRSTVSRTSMGDGGSESTDRLRNQASRIKPCRRIHCSLSVWPDRLASRVSCSVGYVQSCDRRRQRPMVLSNMRFPWSLLFANGLAPDVSDYQMATTTLSVRGCPCR